MEQIIILRFHTNPPVCSCHNMKGNSKNIILVIICPAILTGQQCYLLLLQNTYIGKVVNMPGGDVRQSSFTWMLCLGMNILHSDSPVYQLYYEHFPQLGAFYHPYRICVQELKDMKC